MSTRTRPYRDNQGRPTESEFPVGVRVLHKIDGCEGVVTAHKEQGKYGGTIVVRWQDCDTDDAAYLAEFSSYRSAELLRV